MSQKEREREREREREKETVKEREKRGVESGDQKGLVKVGEWTVYLHWLNVSQQLDDELGRYTLEN